jgi:hypothetical protein
VTDYDDEYDEAMEAHNEHQPDDANTFVLDREHVFVCYRVECEGNVIETSAAVPYSPAACNLTRSEFAELVLRRLMAASEQPRDK